MSFAGRNRSCKRADIPPRPAPSSRIRGDGGSASDGPSVRSIRVDRRTLLKLMNQRLNQFISAILDSNSDPRVGQDTWSLGEGTGVAPNLGQPYSERLEFGNGSLGFVSDLDMSEVEPAFPSRPCSPKEPLLDGIFRSRERQSDEPRGRSVEQKRG